MIYDIMYDISRNSLYMGRMGMPCLMYVASMYRTMDIGTVPGPTRSCASSKVSDPLASPPNTRSPFASVLSLNPKC